MCKNDTTDWTEHLERTWNIELPDDIEKIYSLENAGAFGDGTRYYVYKCGSDPTVTIQGFLNERDPTAEEDMKSIIRDVSKITELNEEYTLDFSKEYLWMKLDRADDWGYLLYCPESMRLCFIFNYT